jgi:hypothetical protein
MNGVALRSHHYQDGSPQDTVIECHLLSQFSYRLCTYIYVNVFIYIWKSVSLNYDSIILRKSIFYYFFNISFFLILRCAIFVCKELSTDVSDTKITNIFLAVIYYFKHTCMYIHIHIRIRI